MPLDRSKDLDLEGRRRHTLYRSIGLGLLALLVLAALLNAFGQGTSSHSAASTAANLSIDAPSRLRGGLLYQVRFEIDARRRIQQPRLVLGEEWINDLTMNTLEPTPTDENSDGDSLSLTFPPLAAGGSRTVWTEWQVNPTRFGRRNQAVALYDGKKLLLKTDRPLTVFP